MLDFEPVRRRQISLADFALREGYDRSDLIRFTNEMIDLQLHLITDIVDTDVAFVPDDPDAHDPYADHADDVHIAWTLGHIIAHVTASSEETCAHAATLARGVEVLGRNRYEAPWQELRTAADLRHRLQESRRMRLAYLDAWPDEPHYEQTYTPYKSAQNCVARVLAGLFHDDSHLEQIREVVRQARAARAPQSERSSTSTRS